METPTCIYLRTSGGHCGSPALRDEKYCFFHKQLRFHMPNTELFRDLIGEFEPGVMPTIHTFDFPLLDDAAAVQIGFMQVVHGISHGLLKPRQAQLVLSALHGAAANLKFMNRMVDEAAKEWRALAKPPASVKTVQATQKKAG